MKSNYSVKRVTLSNYQTTTYFEWTAGPRKILLVHGFPETPHIWEEMAQLLVHEGYTVIAPYLLGYEKEQQYDHVITLQELADWLNAFADAIVSESGEKIFLVGHDFGAAAAYAALLNPNHRFSHYVALAIPPLRSFLMTFITHPIIASRRKYILKFCLPFGMGKKRITKHNFSKLKRLMMKWCEGAEQSTAYFRSDLAYERLPDLDGPLALYRGILPNISKFNSWRKQFGLAFTTLTTPTSIFVGADETTYPKDIFKDYRSQYDPLTPCSLHVVPNCGHFIPLDAPEFVVLHIVEMLGWKEG